MCEETFALCRNHLTPLYLILSFGIHSLSFVPQYSMAEGIPNAYAICTPPNSIYTVDDNYSTADSMLIENGVILATGSVGTLNICQ